MHKELELYNQAQNPESTNKQFLCAVNAKTIWSNRTLQDSILRGAAGVPPWNARVVTAAPVGEGNSHYRSAQQLGCCYARDGTKEPLRFYAFFLTTNCFSRTETLFNFSSTH